MIFVQRGSDDEHKRKPTFSAELLREYLTGFGFRAERKGELHAAVDLYANAVAVDPNSAAAWYNYGDALLALGRLEEAVAALTNALERAPEHALYRYDLGLGLLKLRRYEAAAKEFVAVTVADPELKRASSSLVLSAMTNLALSLEGLGDLKSAIAVLSPSVAMIIGVLYNTGRFHFLAKNPADALVFAQAAAALGPQSEDAVHLCGRILMALGREAEALDYLRKATRLNSKCADAWYDLGVVLARLGKRHTARTCFLKLIRMVPGYTWAYYDLACLDALDHRVNSAFARLEKAASLGFNALSHMRKDTDFRSIRKDARWKAIQKRVQLNQKSSLA